MLFIKFLYTVEIIHKHDHTVPCYTVSWYYHLISSLHHGGELDFTKYNMFQHVTVFVDPGTKGTRLQFVKLRLTARVWCFYISVIHLLFPSAFGDMLLVG